MIPHEELDKLKIGEEAKQLIRQGSWSIEKTTTGYSLKTEPYSQCCNPHGQTEFLLDAEGNVFSQRRVEHEHG